MNDDQIIDEILDREKEQQPPYLSKNDRGGRTNWGISERSYPDVWREGPPDRAKAASIYRRDFVAPWNWVFYEPLRVQLIDCTVLHGYQRAVKLLQQTFRVAVDGIAGEETRTTVNSRMTGHGFAYNNTLVAFRLKFIDDITDADVKQKVNEEGWENRALKFLV